MCSKDGIRVEYDSDILEYLVHMNTEYREPITKKELTELFRLRYEVYSKDEKLNQMISSNANLDINSYDLNAFHFGAFQDGLAVGYVRLATQHNTAFTSWVAEIIEHEKIEIAPVPHEFPFQAYYPDTMWGKNFINSLRGRSIGEMGKLAIHEDFRGGEELLNDLISSFLGYCINDLKLETGFGSCSLLLERYYRKFGCEYPVLL